MVGTDVAPDAIRLARDNPMFRQGPAPEFLVADTERLEFEEAFDAVIFFDSLHHAVDELAALRCAYRALRPGGVCVALEPGRGHNRKSAEVEAGYDVTEKDMPPLYIRRVGRRVGFRRSTMLPAPQHLAKALFANHRIEAWWLRKLLGIWPLRASVVLGILAMQGWYCGIIVLHKDPPNV